MAFLLTTHKSKQFSLLSTTFAGKTKFFIHSDSLDYLLSICYGHWTWEFSFIIKNIYTTDEYKQQIFCFAFFFYSCDDLMKKREIFLCFHCKGGKILSFFKCFYLTFILISRAFTHFLTYQKSIYKFKEIFFRWIYFEISQIETDNFPLQAIFSSSLPLNSNVT